MITHVERAERLVARWEHGDEVHRAWLRSVAVPDLCDTFAKIDDHRAAMLTELQACADLLSAALVCGSPDRSKYDERLRAIEAILREVEG
jgi:hypothetical protein